MPIPIAATTMDELITMNSSGITIFVVMDSVSASVLELFEELPPSPPSEVSYTTGKLKV